MKGQWNKELFLCKDKIKRPLAKLTERERRPTPPPPQKKRWKGDITTDNAEIQRIIRQYFENLHSNKLENLYEMDISLYVSQHI
jgi:hypothetical protein